MDSVILIDLAVSFSFGYILGSIPFGFVLVYLAKTKIYGRLVQVISVQQMCCGQAIRAGILDPYSGRIERHYCLFYCLFMAAARDRSTCWIWLSSWSLFSCMAAFCRRKGCGDRNGCHHCCCSIYRIDNGSDMAACSSFYTYLLSFSSA